VEDRPLFSDGNLVAALQTGIGKAIHKVESIPENQVLTASETDLLADLIEESRANPIILKKDQMYQRQPKEVRVRQQDVGEVFSLTGVQITVVLPFEGDSSILRLLPPTFSMSPPRAEITGQEIILTYQFTNPTPSEVEQRYSHDIRKIEQNLNWGAEQVHTYNLQLETTLREAIARRKKRLLDHQGLAAALNLPLKRRDVPPTYTIPMTRRRPKIGLSPATTAAFKPEPALADDDYQFILKIIQDMSLVMERSPHTFAKLQEEEIRDLFLLQLNGHYEGRATAETFNGDGKTDILIRHEGQNVFIAECTLWKGDRYLTQKIDQLLGYKSWRDTKTAILLFSHNRDFSAVLAKIPEVIKVHPNFKKELEHPSQTDFRFLFSHRGDNNREFVLTVLAFNVPTDITA
jgi:hypothetical protein